MMLLEIIVIYELEHRRRMLLLLAAALMRKWEAADAITGRVACHVRLTVTTERSVLTSFAGKVKEQTTSRTT